MVPYSGNTDDSAMDCREEDLGTQIPGVEWPSDIEELKKWHEGKE
jgi:hypothetical protein